MNDFTAYSVGLMTASVCTSLPIGKATKRLNIEHPTGTDTEWKLSDDKTFAGDRPNPGPCERKPETHVHYLFNC